MKIGVVEHFDSMHYLPGHPKCGVPHGHTYKVEVVLEGKVRDGFLVDFDILKTLIKKIIDQLDHRNLNEIIKMPSCENIAVHIHNGIKSAHSDKIITVKIWEGEGKWAEYSE